MSSNSKSIKDSSKYWLLNKSIPDFDSPNPRLIRQFNMAYSLPFLYTGTTLLSPEGQVWASRLKDIAGRCLGGGVLSSRDLEWFCGGKVGTKPGDYIPSKGLLGKSREPQSVLPSEWIAFEYGLMLRAPFGTPMLNSWDNIASIAKVREQGQDIHIRIDILSGETIETIFAQANRHGIKDLLTITSLTGVTVYQ